MKLEIHLAMGDKVLVEYEKNVCPFVVVILALLPLRLGIFRVSKTPTYTVRKAFLYKFDVFIA